MRWQNKFIFPWSPVSKQSTTCENNNFACRTQSVTLSRQSERTSERTPLGAQRLSGLSRHLCRWTAPALGNHQPAEPQVLSRRLYLLPGSRGKWPVPFCHRWGWPTDPPHLRAPASLLFECRSVPFLYGTEMWLPWFSFFFLNRFPGFFGEQNSC